MNNKFLSALLLSSVLALAVPTHSYATPLGLNTGLPMLEASFAFVDYLEFGPDGDLSAFGAEVDFTDGVSPVGFTEIGFGVGFLLTDPTSGATGGFDVFDDNGLYLAGNLIAVGFSDDLIELQFDSLFGAGAGNFGSSVLASIYFDDVLGPNPFASLVDGDFYTASITLSNVADNVSSVPIPATLPLFLSGLCFLGWIRRRSMVKQKGLGHDEK